MLRLLLFTAGLWGTAVTVFSYSGWGATCSFPGLPLTCISSKGGQKQWTAVEKNAKIPWDLEGTSLQIKTNSTLGSVEIIVVSVYDKDSHWLGGVGVKFSSPMQYYISSCTSGYKDLPVQPPVEVDKIWTTTKTETALIITCNNVEVLNYLFVDSSDSNCVPTWGGDVELRS
eukprot:sb/3472138/